MRLSSGVSILLGLPFLLVGLLVYSLPALITWRYLDTARWTVVDARVLSSEVQSKTSTDSDGRTSTTHRLAVEYEYDLDGETWRSTRGELMDIWTGSSDRVHQRNRQLQEAMRNSVPVRAWVNPDDPAQAVLYRHLNLSLFIFTIGFGTVFVLVGAIASLGGVRSLMDQGWVTRAMRRHPDQPWMHRREWDQARMVDFTPFTIRLLFGAVAYVAVILVVLLVLFGLSFSEGFAWSKTFLLIMPAVLVAGIVFALRRLIQYWRYGVSTLVFDTFPAFIGDGFRGAVVTRQPIPVSEPFEVRLECRKSETRGAGKRRRTTTTTIWESEPQHIDDLEGRRSGRSVVPFEIPLPPDAGHETRPAGNPRYTWKLKVKATTPGPDYRTEFTVPVYAQGGHKAMALS